MCYCAFPSLPLPSRRPCLGRMVLTVPLLPSSSPRPTDVNILDLLWMWAAPNSVRRPRRRLAPCATSTPRLTPPFPRPADRLLHGVLPFDARPARECHRHVAQLARLPLARQGHQPVYPYLSVPPLCSRARSRPRADAHVARDSDPPFTMTVILHHYPGREERWPGIVRVGGIPWWQKMILGIGFCALSPHPRSSGRAPGC